MVATYTYWPTSYWPTAYWPETYWPGLYGVDYAVELTLARNGGLGVSATSAALGTLSIGRVAGFTTAGVSAARAGTLTLARTQDI